jgi:hypothetical protein
MSVLHQEIKSLIQLKVCETHHQHPGISVRDGGFNISCCCNKFKIECYDEIISLLKCDNPKQYMQLLVKKQMVSGKSALTEASISYTVPGQNSHCPTTLLSTLSSCPYSSQF